MARKPDPRLELLTRRLSGEEPVTTEAVEKPAPPPKTHKVPEVIPRPGDPDFITAVIVSLVDNAGDVDATLREMDCTFADYLSIVSTAEFKTALDNIVKARVDIPNRLAVRLALTEKAKMGDGYIANVLHNTRLGETIPEEEQRALAELRMADRRTLGRHLESNARRLIGMLEVVRGRRYTLTEEAADGNEPTILEPTAVDIAADISQPYEHAATPTDGE